MNNQKFCNMFLISVLLLLFLAVFVQAEVEITTGLTNNIVNLNVDYSNLKEDNKSLTLSPLSLTFKNNGSSSETISLSLVNIPTSYTLSLDNTSFTLGNSTSNTSTKKVNLNAVVPADVDSGNHSLGVLRVNSKDYSIKSTVKSMIELEEIDFYVDGSKEDSISKSGKTFDTVKPGSKIELKFKLENKFDKKYDYGDIDDIEVTVIFDDEDDEDDFGDEIDEEEDLDLDADESGEVKIKFDVPSDAEEGKYDLLIKIEGEDDNGAKHTVEWTVTLEVDKEKDDVRIVTASLGAGNLSCFRQTDFRTKITNYGSNDHDDVALSIYSKELNISFNAVNIELEDDPEDSDGSYSKTIPISLSKDFKAGTYSLEAIVYVDDNEQVDRKVVYLTVTDCKTTSSDNENKKNETEVVVVTSGSSSSSGSGGTIPTSTVTTDSSVVNSVETPFSQIKGVVIFMGIVVALLVVLIVLMIYVLIRR